MPFGRGGNERANEEPRISYVHDPDCVSALINGIRRSAGNRNRNSPGPVAEVWRGQSHAIIVDNTAAAAAAAELSPPNGPLFPPPPVAE